MIVSIKVYKSNRHSQAKSSTENKKSLPLECLFKRLLLFGTPLSCIFLERCQIASHTWLVLLTILIVRGQWDAYLLQGSVTILIFLSNIRIQKLVQLSRRAYLCLKPLDLMRKNHGFLPTTAWTNPMTEIFTTSESEAFFSTPFSAALPWKMSLQNFNLKALTYPAFNSKNKRLHVCPCLTHL